MTSVLKYGIESSIQLEFADGVLLAECGTPSGSPLEDPTATADAALADPLDFPPLSRSTTPGDQVVVALEDGVPCSGEVTAAVVRALIAAGVHADGITVLRTNHNTAAGIGDPRDWLSGDAKKRIHLATHNPKDRNAIAYLAADDGGQPILLNRLIVDADLVLPIGSPVGAAVGSHGVFAPVYPTFSDIRTLDRFRSIDAADSRHHKAKSLAKEVNHVGWLLGVAFAVQVIPSGGDAAMHVLAGEAGAVGRRATELGKTIWRSRAPRRASLVVAGISGSSAYQTWHNVGLALQAAGKLVLDGGAVVICCDVDRRPQLPPEDRFPEDEHDEQTDSTQAQRHDDLLPDTQLAVARNRGQVYLLSRLDQSLVEDLDIAPVADHEELARLVSRHESCILLANAAHAIVTAEQDE